MNSETNTETSSFVDMIVTVAKGCRYMSLNKGDMIMVRFNARAPRARTTCFILPGFARMSMHSKCMSISKVEPDGSMVRMHTGNPEQNIVVKLPPHIAALVRADREARKLPTWTAAGGKGQ